MENPKFNYKKLKCKIFETLGSQAKLAELLDISVTALNKKLNNKTQFSQCDIDSICKILGICIDEIGEYFFTLEN